MCSPSTRTPYYTRRAAAAHDDDDAADPVPEQNMADEQKVADAV